MNELRTLVAACFTLLIFLVSCGEKAAPPISYIPHESSQTKSESEKSSPPTESKKEIQARDRIDDWSYTTLANGKYRYFTNKYTRGNWGRIRGKYETYNSARTLEFGYYLVKASLALSADTYSFTVSIFAEAKPDKAVKNLRWRGQFHNGALRHLWLIFPGNQVSGSVGELDGLAHFDIVENHGTFEVRNLTFVKANILKDFLLEEFDLAEVAPMTLSLVNSYDDIE